MSSVLCFSGGLDSVIAWFYLSYQLNYKVEASLYCKFGHRYEEEELAALTALNEQFSLHSLDPKIVVSSVYSSYGGIREEANANIPARNLLLAVEAANRGGNLIHIVCQKDERSLEDRSERFFKDASTMLAGLYNEQYLRVDPVFPDWDKTQMVEWFLMTPKFSLSYHQRLGFIRKTVACYQPVSSVPCGNCGACFRRAVALANSKIFEEHAEPVFESATAKRYIEKNRDYSPERQKRTKMALYLAGSSLYSSVGESV